MPSIEQSTQFLRTRQFGLLMMALVIAAALALPFGVRHLGFTGLVVISGLAAALLAVQLHPVAFFGLYFGALFFAETPLPGLSGATANQVLAILFLLSFASYWMRGHAMKLTSGMLPALGVLALYFGISALTGENFERGIVHFRYVVIYFLLAVCLARSLGSERTILAFAAIITVLTFAAAIDGFIEAIEKDALSSFTGGRWGTVVRIRGAAKNSIVYAWGLLFAFPFAFLLFSELKRGWLRLLSLAAGLFILLVATLTFNRQTIAAVGVLVILCTVLFAYKNRAVLLALVGTAGAIAASTVLPMLILRLTTLRTVSRDPSYLERRDSFLIGMEMFKKDPLFGVGLGSFPAVWREYLPPDFSTYYAQYMGPPQQKFPDFGFLALLSETGVVGLLLYVALYGLILWRTWKLHRAARRRGDMFARNLTALVLTLTIYVLITSMIQDTFLYVRVWVLYALVLLMDERLLFGKEEPATAET